MSCCRATQETKGFRLLRWRYYGHRPGPGCRFFVEFDVSANLSSSFFGCGLFFSYYGATHEKIRFIFGVIKGTGRGLEAGFCRVRRFGNQWSTSGVHFFVLLWDDARKNRVLITSTALCGGIIMAPTGTRVQIFFEFDVSANQSSTCFGCGLFSPGVGQRVKKARFSSIRWRYYGHRPRPGCRFSSSVIHRVWRSFLSLCGGQLLEGRVVHFCSMIVKGVGEVVCAHSTGEAVANLFCY